MLMTLILVIRFWQQNFSDKDKDKLRKASSKFYQLHYDRVSKYNVGLKTLLLQDLKLRT